MKPQSNPTSTYLLLLLGGISLLPSSSHAKSLQASHVSVEMSMTAYLIIGFLLVLSTIMFFLFQHRFNRTAHELKDLSSELGTTRQRLVNSNKELTQSQKDLKTTTNRYQNILFEANIGMFQMDMYGQCTYINTALQEMSGLYPKKALKKGLSSAIHPDDRETFDAAWSAFINDGVDFNHIFRFKRTKGENVYVECQANKVINEKKEVESYIGWVSDVTDFHNEKLVQQAETARVEHFISETIEGFYKLEPKAPLPLASDPSKMADTIIAKLVLTDCNTTFAAMYGAKPADLLGKPITELKDGCGPFKNNDTLKAFIKTNYQAIDFESIRQDANGNRINLLNNAVGLVEDNKLIGIWGSQRNISQLKREKAELSSQVTFMHRILNALPADVHVKDTRCRYLYASKKLADRTGIPQEEWVGKTTFEVMPATPRDHDRTAIESMKSGKLNRTERPYEVRGKSGWLETIHIPLVSEEELVEGVVSLSLEISDRKKKEEVALRFRNELEKQLQNTQTDLSSSQIEHRKTATSLSETIQKLKIVEIEKLNREHEFNEQLAERKRSEETLRRSEQGLLTRQQQLEEHLSKRLSELNTETDKRKKWEALLAIKEEDLRKLEKHETQLSKHYEQETALRKQTEASLATTQTVAEKYRTELDTLSVKHQSELDTEHRERTKTEKLLAKTKGVLQSTQEQIKQMTEQHAKELEKEVATRKTAAKKLLQSMEELNEFRQQFNQRLEGESKSIKQELAQKQIREKALRQHEKDLEERIKKLEKTLRTKTKESSEQIHAREGAEAQKQKIEHKMEVMSEQQQKLIDRETEKLILDVAEIRLDEAKLHKRIHDLEEEREILKETLRIRNNDL